VLRVGSPDGLDQGAAPGAEFRGEDPGLLVEGAACGLVPVTSAVYLRFCQAVPFMRLGSRACRCTVASCRDAFRLLIDLPRLGGDR
jgi:hypothetical protein